MINKIKERFEEHVYLIRLSFWTILRIYGYYYKSKLTPITSVIGIRNEKDLKFWITEVEKLNIKVQKLPDSKGLL